MMLINYRTTLLKFKSSYRYYSSALYITGDKAQNNFAVLTPVIDFDQRIKNKDDLLKNVKARGLQIDIEDVIKRWTFFQEILKRKHLLEVKRVDIAQNVAALLKCPDTDPLEIEKLKMHSRLVKSDLKNLKSGSYDIEEKTMIQVLDLPNDLHSKTPLHQENNIYTYLQKPENNSLNHMDIGKEMNYIKYLDPFTCYLKSDAALLEIKLLNYFRCALLKLNYLQFSNPNFCRSIISEGCDEICHIDKKMLNIEEHSIEGSHINKLHLCGSASLFSFMAYFSRHLVPQNLLPLKYFSVGKIYHPVKIESTPSLFNLSQQSVISIFFASVEDSEVNLDLLIEEISNVYNFLDVHYRLVILPASKIDKAESLRISIQMYSNFKKQYIEVGNVSFYDSYVSKKLLFTYMSNKEKRYPKIVSGSLLNFHKFLGCILENVDNKMLTEYLKKIKIK